MVRRNTLYLGAIAAGLVSLYLFKDKMPFSAEGDEKSLLQTIKDRFTPSELEEVNTERTGATVDVIPMALTPSYLGQQFLQMDRSDRVVNMSPFGIGVSDVRVEQVNPYDYELSAQDFKAEVGIGQEPNSLLNEMKTSRPHSLNKPTISTVTRLGEPLPNERTHTDMLHPSDNAQYTSGGETKTLANWRMDHYIESEGSHLAWAIPMDGSMRKHLRRV